MSTDKPIVPNEWTDFYVALADFGNACGAFHASDPVKAEAMARVFNEAADMLNSGHDERLMHWSADGQGFAAELVTRARKPGQGSPPFTREDIDRWRREIRDAPLIPMPRSQTRPRRWATRRRLPTGKVNPSGW